ncbi:MAG TPA: phosphate ABC transporter permease PstA [Mycobacteriales bacterium]|nr:phosphate ABC transporter permease PstA [Mycobacteriales bacterium]
MSTGPGPLAAGSMPARVELAGSGRRLTPLFRLAIAAATVVVTLLLFAVTPMQGRVDFVIFAIGLFAVLQTAISFATEGRRFALDRLLALFVHLALLAALIPLLAVIAYTVISGVKKLDLQFLTHNLTGIGPLDTNGGEYHAIIGTLEQVLITIVISVPLGLLVSIYITEYGRGALASSIRFVVDVMTGIPSIVAGLFIYAFLVLGLHQGYSGFAAALSLTILMLPVVVRSSEEMIKLVPDELREAAFALGVPKWKTILRVVLPTASAGITTGVMIAVARVTGETAPLLLTSFVSPATNFSALHGKQTAIPTFIFDQAGQGQEITYDRAWAAALTLIVIVLVLYAGARLLTRRNSLARR